MSVDYKQIGRQIRKYRKARGLTQEELAGAVDISPTHMSHIETAGTKLSLPVLLDLADSLQVPPGSLIRDDAGPGTDGVLQEAMELLASSSEEEMRIMLDVLKTMRFSLRKYQDHGSRENPGPPTA